MAMRLTELLKEAITKSQTEEGQPALVTVRPTRGRTVVRIVLGGDW